MAKNFAALAFTDTVKEMQEKIGSRSSYARMERDTYADGLTENEIDFISQQNSFYMASIFSNRSHIKIILLTDEINFIFC